MKKKILSLFLALLILSSTVSTSILVAIAAEVGNVISDTYTPKVSIWSDSRYEISGDDGSAPVEPDASGYAHFIIGATGMITDEITVYYTTEDLSAIAEAGDYEATSGYVVLTAENPRVQISVKTSRTEYSITVNEHNGAKNVEYISRKFLVKITDVKGNADKDDEKSQIECALLAEHNLSAYKFSGGTALTPYTWYGKYDLNNVLNTETIDGGETTTQKMNVSFPANWSSDYVNSNLNANLYMSFQDAHVDESWWNSSSELTLIFAGVTIRVKGEFHDNEEFGWGPAFLSAIYGVNGNSSSKNKYKEYLNENFLLTMYKSYDGSVVSFTNEKSTMKSALENGYVIRRNWQYYGEPHSSSDDPGAYYIALNKEVLGWPALEMLLMSHGGYSRKLNGGSVSFRLEDITAPKIETDSYGNYVMYNNFDTATKGEKLRVAIRFDEPVQVNGKDPYFTGKVNGIGSGIEPHPYAIKFNYVGGSGTDTLYFEAEYNGDYHITSITDLTFKYASSITDYAGVPNSFAPDSNISIDGFNLDKRVPTISVSSNDSKMTPHGLSRQIAVTVSNISDEGTLYYVWTDSNEKEDIPQTIADFTNKITLKGTQTKDYTTVSITGDGDGRKYLHLMAVSRYGQEQRNILIVSSTTTPAEYLGPYDFDNSPPTVDETALLPQTDGSSPYMKRYVIPMPADAGSGFSELKMYYVGEDGQDHLISNKVYNKNSFKANASIEALLAAEELGIGDNERRSVTVFFTMTDALGNTDTDVARHTLIFDTHTYIDVERSEASSDFSDKTEVIDEGYVLIYTGNASETTNSNGAYYSFELDVLKQNINGETRIRIKKNGVTLNENDGYRIVNTESVVDGKTVVTMRLDFTSPMGDGYYDIQIQSFEPEGTSGVSESTDGPARVSMEYRLYVGSGKGQLDNIVSNGTLLVNKVYQLPPSSYFYYMDTNYSIDTVVKALYNGTSLPASFSTKEQAYKYVLFNEYRDLYAVRLSAGLAETLNMDNSNVQKASGEITVAREGQVWIRYKSADWSVESANDKTKWAYYYYGSSEVLDVNYFTTNLQNAIESVAQNIVDRGFEETLPNVSAYSGEALSSLINKLGVPTLEPEQLHTADRLLRDEICSSRFVNEITYQGDDAIYSSEIMINGVEHILIGTVAIPTGCRLQYKRIDESGQEDKNWSELSFTAGQRFGDVLTETGRYKIRELGSGGVSVFYVYIDREAPMVLVSWKGRDGVSNSQILNKYSERDFRAKSLRIVGIDAREYDRYSYVVLYKTTTYEIVGIYSMVDLQNSAVNVPDGDYYMAIGDRSGNSYVMTIHINSSELQPVITQSENIKVKFSCNRKASQIQDFYVKRDGVLISTKYAPELEFTESGSYEFYIKDIYGNVFGPHIEDFRRAYPEVEWKYRDVNGQYVTYNKNNETKQFSVKGAGDGMYTVSTSVAMKFKLTGDYGYTFLGIAPEHEQNLNDGTVTIKNVQVFQLKVYYKKHPDVYTIYNCTVDTIPPIIDVSIQVDNPMPDEIEELRKALENGTVVKDGDKLIPSTISYSSKMSQTKYIANNDTVLSDFMRVSVSDANGLSSVYVYLDGELIKELIGAGTGSDIALTESGKYKIVAEDTFGNQSEFNFTNGTPESIIYVVDGMPYLLGLHDFENFDDNGVYNDIVYGNESVAIYANERINAFYMITDSNGVKYFVAFDVNEGVIREAYYSTDEEGNVILSVSDKVLFDGRDPKVVVNKGYEIFTASDEKIKIYASITGGGVIVLEIFANDDPSILVETRINTEDGEFYYTKTELSSYYANLMMRTEDGVLELMESDDIVMMNRWFSIAQTNFESSKISYVCVYYSTANDFGDYGYFFKEEIYADNAKYDKEGFYYVILVNEYGNESCFTIHISYEFNITSYVEFADNQKIYFSSEYKDTLYSNNKIVYEIYANGVTIDIKKDGKDYTPRIETGSGVTYVILYEPGKYDVSFADAYKNGIEGVAEISSPNVGFNENLLIGYNQNALKKDEGYTNQMLSVNKAVFDRESISYLEIQYGDTSIVLYDSISEIMVKLDETKLINCVGNLGDGVYTVIMRDRFGSMFTKVVHYRSTPTLTLERETRSSTVAEPYDISKALEVGFWSNSELIFKTDATNYIFTVNKDKTECPLRLSFTAAEQHGRTEYDITYVDEYGFTYSFKAYLVRQDVEITPDLVGDSQYIDGVLTTVGGISVKFTENAYCTYTWNNSAETVYVPGEVLNRDGVYRFVVMDHAGNAKTLTVKKDVIVEFAFVDGNSSTVIQSGGVVNASKVEFQALNGDSAFIEKVFKNGVLQTEFSGSKFSSDGKWEMIVSDKLGNKSYFCFYIINKQKDKFAYTTPYEYHVTELWYDSGDGVKLSYMKFVNHTETTSSFEFFENGTYTVVMTSSVTGSTSQFTFTINTNAPNVSLVGCNVGETTINDITLQGCVIGDRIKVYKATRNGETLVEELEVSNSLTKMPTISEGGEYRIVVESEAGVATELSFVRKHIMNTSGSVFVLIVIGLSVIGLFTGLVYRNKSKTDK